MPSRTTVHAVMHRGSCSDCESQTDDYVVKIFTSEQTARQFVDMHRDDWDGAAYFYYPYQVYSSIKESGLY